MSNPAPTLPLRQLRTRYQQGMLVWLQSPGDPAGLPEMRGAVRQLEAASQGEFAEFWRTAEHFLRAVSDGTLAVDGEARRLCARIDLQMRAALGAAPSPASALAAELQQRIRQGAGQLPPAPELISLIAKPEAPDLDQEAVAHWQAAGAALTASWEPGGQADHTPFRRALIELCGAATQLELPETLQLAEALAGVGDRLDDPASAQDPYLRAAVAAALELLASPDDLGLPVFAQRVEHVAQRLADSQQADRPAISPVLLQLFAGEIREQTALMRDELACLHPDAETLVEAALEVADHAAHLELLAAQHLAEALARAVERSATPEAYDHPEIREVLETALAELDTLADYLAAGRELPDTGDITELLTQL